MAEVIIFGAPTCMACASSASKARDEGQDAAPPASDLATARHLGRRVAETTLQSVRGRSAVNLASVARTDRETGHAPAKHVRSVFDLCSFYLLLPAKGG